MTTPTLDEQLRILIDANTAADPDHGYLATDPPPPDRRHLRAVLVAAAAVMVLVVIGISRLAASVTTPADPATSVPSSTTAAASTTISLPTPAEIEAANRRLDQRIADGWVPYGGDAATDTPTPSPAWVRPGFGDVVNGVKPVYDAPDGTIIGYHHTNLGFVSPDKNPTFDARQARIDKYGCDTEEQACKESLSNVNPHGGGPKGQ